MARSIPLAVVNAVNAQTSSQIYFVLVTLSHSTFSTIRVVNNTQAVTSNGQVFSPFPFAVIIPPDDEELQVRAVLTIYDAEREVIDNLRLVAGSRERVAAKLEVIAAATPDSVLQSVSGLEVINTRYRVGELSLDISINNFLTEAFPKDGFNPATVPGIF